MKRENAGKMAVENGSQITQNLNVSVSEYFSGKNIFLTGYTGFVGKVVLEKILRSCENVNKIYVLSRGKKSESVEQRWNKISNSFLFHKVRENNCENLKKVHLIEGDLMAENLGIKKEDLEELYENVNIVIHSAASVRFDEPIRDAIKMNICGTNKILEMCKKLKKIETIVHVSTCYANCDQQIVEEQIYQQKYSPEELMKMSQIYDDKTLEEKTKELIGNKPNTYTFTKSIAELLVKDFSEKHKIPIAIVRPSIIIAALHEITPGWIDNFNGPTGLILAAASGVLRSVFSKEEKRTDFIPVDIVANTIIAACWHTGVFKPEHIKVYNCSSGDRAPPLKWADFANLQNHIVKIVSFDTAIRYPNLSLRSNWYTHQASMILEHYIPAKIFDCFLKAVGKKPMFCRIYDKLVRTQNVLTYFTTHEWTFKTDQVENLRKSLSTEDQNIFRMSMKDVKWDEYLVDYIKGIKYHVLCESVKDHSLNRYQTLYIIKQIETAVLAAATWKLLGIGDWIFTAYDHLF